MIDLHFHPFRKALQLSLNEMAVLKEVYDLSNNTKFGGYCVKSKENIAETLDLSRKTIQSIISILEFKGYVERNEFGHIKPTELIRELSQERERVGIVINSTNYKIASVKITEFVDVCVKKLHGVTDEKKLPEEGEINTPECENKSDTSNSISISLEDQYKETPKEPKPKKAKEEKANTKNLLFIKETFCQKFKEVSGGEYYWKENAREWKTARTLNDQIANFHGLDLKDEKISELFKDFIEKAITLPNEFYKTNFDINLLSSQFNKIMSEISQKYGSGEKVKLDFKKLESEISNPYLIIENIIEDLGDKVKWKMPNGNIEISRKRL